MRVLGTIVSGWRLDNQTQGQSVPYSPTFVYSSISKNVKADDATTFSSAYTNF